MVEWKQLSLIRRGLVVLLLAVGATSITLQLAGVLVSQIAAVVADLGVFGGLLVAVLTLPHEPPAGPNASNPSTPQAPPEKSP